MEGVERDLVRGAVSEFALRDRETTMNLWIVDDLTEVRTGHFLSTSDKRHRLLGFLSCVGKYIVLSVSYCRRT